MQETTTSSKKTDLFPKKTLEELAPMQPSVNTLKNILQFAASYRAEWIDENQIVEWNLN